MGYEFLPVNRGGFLAFSPRPRFGGEGLGVRGLVCGTRKHPLTPNPSPPKRGRGEKDNPSPPKRGRGEKDNPSPPKRGRGEKDNPSPRSGGEGRKITPLPRSGGEGRKITPLPRSGGEGRKITPLPRSEGEGRKPAPGRSRRRRDLLCYQNRFRPLLSLTRDELAQWLSIPIPPVLAAAGKNSSGAVNPSTSKSTGLSSRMPTASTRPP